MKAIAVITARGGSKRIPQKNIRKFCGKPIIAYSIEAALNSDIFEEVMVSTDSDEIVCVAKDYGASVPFLRSRENSNDFATTADVLEEVLDKYEKMGNRYDVICCIYPTAPFVNSVKLKMAFAKMEEEQADSLMPVVKYGFPPQRAVVIRGGRIRYNQPEHEKSRSQDFEQLYHDCGQFYVCKVDVFKESHSLVTDNTVPFIMPEEEVQDIDNISDWRLAEIKYKKYIGC
jgi:N-acylneuraminate cytidylyltransferase